MVIKTNAVIKINIILNYNYFIYHSTVWYLSERDVILLLLLNTEKDYEKN